MPTNNRGVEFTQNIWGIAEKHQDDPVVPGEALSPGHEADLFQYVHQEIRNGPFTLSEALDALAAFNTMSNFALGQLNVEGIDIGNN